MRLSSNGLAVGLVLHATASTAWNLKGIEGLRMSYFDGGDDIPEVVPVPSYNISMPIDHFNPSDTRTFNNRFFVNDTYYKPGGPVILYDFGESGVDDWYAAVLLGGWNGSLSAPLELAKARGGVVIGWEHRYYGYSMPFAVTREAGDTPAANDDPYAAGIPLGGAADYRYLTVKQALEDVAYFARRLNQTALDGSRNAVLSGPGATRHLDPSHTPWIWVGGSYPAMRGAWMRLRNPDIVYAVWASSAPVQTVPDGSAYPNSIYRALPANCSAYMHAAVRYVDEILDSGNQTRMLHLGKQLDAAEYSFKRKSRRSSSSSSSSYPSSFTNYDIAEFREVLWGLFQGLIGNAQSEGYTGGLQDFCDNMEAFDVPGYFQALDHHSSVLARDDDTIFLSNFGDAKPSDKGIAATNGDRGGEAVLAAYLFAMNGYGNSRYYQRTKRRRSVPSSSSPADKKPSGAYEYITPWQDAHSWEWQVLSEIGLVLSANGSSEYSIGSRYLTHEYSRASVIATYFANFSAESDFPPEPDNSYPIGFGGWRMTISNTMFTDGQFDPWRAYGVNTLDKELDGFPRSGGVRQDPVPGCGQTGLINEKYGIVYPGAVHAEDMVMVPGDPLQGSQNLTHPPLKQGLELFLRALDVWLPCFNGSKGQTPGMDPLGPNNKANSTGDAGDRNGAAGGAGPGMAGGWAVVGVLSFFVYQLL